jgi:hypothetical protein
MISEFNLNTFADLFESLAISTAAITGLLGIEQWRNKMVSEKRMELAEEVADLYSMFPNVIHNIRNPHSNSDEGRSVTPEGEDPRIGHATLERINNHSDYFERLDRVRYRFLAFFGKEHDEHFKQSEMIKHKIQLAAMTLASDRPNLSSKKRLELEAIIWFTYFA